MKFLVFGGGLGNQIFEYAYYLYLKSKYPQKRYYGFYKIRLKGHNGLEIDKRFKVTLPPSTWLSNSCVYLLYLIRKTIPRLKIFDLNIDVFNEKAILHNALKIDKRIIPTDNNWLQFRLDENTLSKENRDVLESIRNNNSCFIHVRRGDYITGIWASHYEGCCPLEYYEKSINDIQIKSANVRFYCFSDDIKWMKQNLSLPPNTVFISWNKGNDSFIDMFLMSQCKNAIMANSTFSYWATILGRKKEFVYYPEKWINGKTPDIFYNNWIKF